MNARSILTVWVLVFAGSLGAAEPAAIDEIPIDDFDRGHWAYRPIEMPEVPTVNNEPWARTPIDRFVLAKLEADSQPPPAEADRATLLRRVTFNLIGLPPTPQQLDAFLSDSRPGAWRRVVERLLASPQYARRWAQHWLDLARFAETDGFEHDKVRPTAWRYRDWVIEALSSDMPYDRFLTLQLAGDCIETATPNADVATAFCLSGPDMPDINSMKERKDALMNDITATVGSVVMSLQMGCAQCHDHKFDAISQADFYRLRAFFEPAVELKRFSPVTTLDADADPDAVARLYHRGDWRRPGPVVQAAYPRIANPDEKRPETTDPGQARLDLAHWLTDRSNPLVARSIANRLWQWHFGKGLSSTPSDFGVMGAPPTHPELLDYLAARLMERRWSLKDLHREILLSATYQAESGSEPGMFARQRLDAEVIRDAMLAASGVLHHEYGGPGTFPPLPEEMKSTLLKGQWQTSQREADHYRRSVYVFARRNLRYPLFATFDRPAANSSCARRHESTTAIQSLLLLNSQFTMDAAERLATLVSQQHPDRSQQCREIHRRVLSQNAKPDELARWVEFLDQHSRLLQQEGHKSPQKAALVDLCRAVFNSNAFLYVD